MTSPADDSADRAAVSGAADDPPPGAAEGLGPVLDELRALIADGRAFAAAELTFQATRARVAARGARSIALYGLFALIFVVFALGGLTVGLILALTPLVSAWGATAIVVGALALGAGLCALRALAVWRRLVRALTGPDA